MASITTQEVKIEVKRSGRPTKTNECWINLFLYVGNCLQYVTLGSAILEAVTPAWALRRMMKIYKLRNWCLVVSFLLVVTHTVLGCLNVFVEPEDRHHVDIKWILLPAVLFSLVSCLLSVCNMWVYLYLYIPLELVWDFALVFSVGDTDLGGTSNDFLELSRHSTIQHVGTDLDSYVFAAALDSVASIKVMLYNNSWYQQNFRSARSQMYVQLFTGFCMIAVFPLTYYWTKHLPQFELWQIEIDPEYLLAFLPFFLVAALALFHTICVLFFFLVGKPIFVILDVLLCSLLSDFGTRIKERIKERIWSSVSTRLNTESNFVKLEFVQQ